MRSVTVRCCVAFATVDPLTPFAQNTISWQFSNYFILCRHTQNTCRRTRKVTYAMYTFKECLRIKMVIRIQFSFGKYNSKKPIT